MMKKYMIIIILLFLSCESNTLNSANDQTNNPENYFSYNISNKVAFYFFNNILINESNLSSNDWIGAFNGEICVGARQWIDCGESTCEIPIYGENNLNQLTEGYMLPNQIPTFIIYDDSDKIYYEANSSTQIPWQDGIYPLIDTLIAG